VKLSVSQIAKENAQYTRTPVFLTGRAGTGKTTWLKELLDESEKKNVVVAPTGVAAINAGGVTIHSMFQLPTTGFIPTDDPMDPSQFTNRSTLAKTQKIRKERIEIILELELLIIDEISMVRADLLDAIDAVLCRIRKNSLPFGGVQVVVIGDLFQLSPVVNQHSFRILSNYYDSPYFFDAWVWKRANPIVLELSKVYRQEDESFINILNNIRIGKKIDADISTLNQRRVPLPRDKSIITLSTHNKKANAINQKEIEALNTEKYALSAEVNGLFSASAFPIKEEIILKKGCQVMFIRNHPEGLYFNGKIGTVTGKFKDEIFVKCEDKSDPIAVAPVEWKNIKYSINKETKKIDKEEIGSFTHHPLKLAWAVTVHKSQGLTFDEVSLDVADTFAPGQLYVALSRCRSMEGLYLKAQIRPVNIIVDDKISKYYDNISNTEFSKDHLAKAKAEYEDIIICEKWNFNKLLTLIETWNEAIEDGNLPEERQVSELANGVNRKLETLNQTGEKFQRQLKTLIAEYKSDDQQLHNIIDRCQKAVLYFTKELHNYIIQPLEKHHSAFKLKGKVKRYLTTLDALITDMWLKMNELYLIKYRSIPVHPEERSFKRVVLFDPNKKLTKKKKGATYDITLDLLNEDKSLAEIAKVRSLAVSTIESHFNKLLKEDKINIDQIIAHDRMEQLLSYFEKNDDISLAELRTKIPFDVSFGELRWVRTYMDKKSSE